MTRIDSGRNCGCGVWLRIGKENRERERIDEDGDENDREISEEKARLVMKIAISEQV